MRWYVSENSCIRYFRKKLARIPFNKIFCDDELYELFRMHYRFFEKTRGKKVIGFIKRPNPLRKNSFTLYAVLEDGTEVDWSYIKACKSMNILSIRRQNILSAFRRAIDPQIAEKLRKNMVRGLIRTSDGILAKREEIEVHHEPSFIELVRRFLAMKHMSIYDVPIKDVGIGYDIADAQLKREWQEFHKKNAKLKILLKKEHRKLHRNIQKNKIQITITNANQSKNVYDNTQSYISQ